MKLTLPYDLDSVVFFCNALKDNEEECEVLQGTVSKYEYRDGELFIGIDEISGQRAILIEVYLVSDTQNGAKIAFYRDLVETKETAVTELKKDITVLQKKIAML